MTLLSKMSRWSWSTSPPPYEEAGEASTESPQPPGQGAFLPPRRSRVQASQWLLTFDKQWLLVHVCAAVASAILILVGFVFFVTGDLNTPFGQVRYSWLAGALGMLSVSASVSLFSKLRRLYATEQPRAQTLEEHSANRFIWTASAVFAEVFLSVVLAIYANSSTCMEDELECETRPTPVRALRAIAILGSVIFIITAIYDIVKLRRSNLSGSVAPYYDEDDRIDDAPEGNGFGINPVRLT